MSIMPLKICVREPLAATRFAVPADDAGGEPIPRPHMRTDGSKGALSPLVDRLTTIFPGAGVSLFEIDEVGRGYVAWHTDSIDFDAVEAAVLGHYGLKSGRRLRLCRIWPSEGPKGAALPSTSFNCALILRFQSRIDGSLYVIAVSLDRPDRQIPVEEEIRLADNADQLVRLIESIKAAVSRELRSAYDNAAVANAPWGILVLGATGNVCFASARAQHMLTRGAGVYVKQGRLRFERATVARTFEQILGNLSAWGDQAARRPPAPSRALSIPGPGGEVCYALSLTPVSSGEDRPGDAAVIGYLSDLLERVPTDRPLLATVFSLTAKEAQLAELFGSGHNLEQSAAVMGISRNTARIHLSNIFSKTGTHNQVELARLLARLPSAGVASDLGLLGSDCFLTVVGKQDQPVLANTFLESRR